MNDDDATTLLNHLAERVPVGPAPVEHLIRSGRSARAHRRRTSVLAVAASVALVLIGGLGVRQALQPNTHLAPAAGPVVSAAPAHAGTRLVGIGHAAIAVPKGWGTNLVHCGHLEADTVLIDQGPINLCGTTLPQTASDVEIQVTTGARNGPGVRNGADLSSASSLDIDGAPALKTKLRCSMQGSSQLCTQSLWIQPERALFTVTSPHASTVRRLLGSVRVDRGYVAVPFTYTADATRDAQSFVRAAEALGLEVETRIVQGSGLPAGSIVSVDPAVGSVLTPGDTVHVVIAAGASPSGQGTPLLTRPADWCPITAQVQRLVVTRSLPGNGITFTFPARVEVHDPAAIAGLVDALCAAPRIPKGAVYNCPNEHGPTYSVTAFDGDAKAWAVNIPGSGCRMLNVMGQGRRSTGDLWQALASAMGVSPPTYQTLAGTPAGQ